LIKKRENNLVIWQLTEMNRYLSTHVEIFSKAVSLSFAKALLGRKVNEEVDVKAPPSILKYKVFLT
jgi:hypothetical protein